MQYRPIASADGGSSGMLASRRLGVASLPRINLLSPEFHSGATLPTRATIDGDGTPPALQWGVLDPAAGSFVVVCEDPDARGTSPFVHWLVYDIPGTTQSLDGNLNDFREGLNDRGQPGYAPAAPPRGAGLHHYHFQLFALNNELTLPAGRDCDRLLAAISGHVTAWGEIVGVYQRF